MNEEEYIRIIEQMKTSIELIKDFDNIDRCIFNLNNFDRLRAWDCLQDMIREYGPQMEILENILSGSEAIRPAQIHEFSNKSLYRQIKYICDNIPAYAALKKGQEEIAKNQELLNALGLIDQNIQINSPNNDYQENYEYEAYRKIA